MQHASDPAFALCRHEADVRLTDAGNGPLAIRQTAGIDFTKRRLSLFGLHDNWNLVDI